MEDLGEAIQRAEQAVSTTPEDHPNLAGMLNNLGNKLESRFGRTGRIEDTTKAFVGLPAYSYTPLSNDTPQIRLLTLLPGGTHDPLEGSLSVVILEELEHDNRHIPSWEALSYCWGSSTVLKPLLISGKVLNITGSLHLALQHLRLSDGERVIWIDQVCINQRDLDERGRQVQHMNVIFKKAGRVTAWLGSGEQESHRYMEMLSVIKGLIHHDLYPRMKKPTPEQEVILFEALTLESSFRNDPTFAANSTHDAKRRHLALLCEAFCRNDWFERLWIVQEAALATHLVLQYGHATVDWHVHSKACLELLWDDLVVGSKLSGSGIGLTDTIQMLKDADYGSSSRSLIVLLNALKSQKTSDARDRVYGLMGMADLQKSKDRDESMIVDYKIAVDQLAEQLTLYCLQTEQTLDVFSICCAGEPVESSRLASWAINLSRGQPCCDQLFSTELRTLDIFSSGMPRPIQYQYTPSTKVLSLVGIEIDTIQQVSKKTHFSEQYGVPRSDVWSEWKAIALKEQDADPYEHMAGRREAFWRTIITNQIWDDPRSEYIKAPEYVAVEFERWSKREDLKSTFEARKAARNSGDWFYNFVGNLMVGNQAHLFRTQRGYLGLACKHIAAGDRVIILWGGHIPSILREAEPESEHKIGAADALNPGPDTRSTYRFIGGQIYVHGLMDGEAADTPQAPREFHIV
jgi:hypothetical protein